MARKAACLAWAFFCHWGIPVWFGSVALILAVCYAECGEKKEREDEDGEALGTALFGRVGVMSPTSGGSPWSVLPKDGVMTVCHV